MTELDFLPHDAMLVQYICCHCVCPSQVGVLWRWLNLGSRRQRHTIAQRFSDAKNLCEIPTGHPQWGVPNRGGVGSNGGFDQYIAISHNRCKRGI